MTEYRKQLGIEYRKHTPNHKRNHWAKPIAYIGSFLLMIIALATLVLAVLYKN